MQETRGVSNFFDSRGRKGRLLKSANQGSAQMSALPLFPINTSYILRREQEHQGGRCSGTAGGGKPNLYLYLQCEQREWV